jgi:hypothetical protein
MLIRFLFKMLMIILKKDLLKLIKKFQENSQFKIRLNMVILKM